MSSGDLTIISIHFCDLLATCMTRCAFNCTFYGDHKIAVAICLHVLDRHLRDVEGNLKGLTHCLTLFSTFSDRYMWTQLIDIPAILHSGKSQRTFAHGMDQLDSIGIDDAEHGRSGQEDLRPVLMGPEETKEAGAFG